MDDNKRNPLTQKIEDFPRSRQNPAIICLAIVGVANGALLAAVVGLGAVSVACTLLIRMLDALIGQFK